MRQTPIRVACLVLLLGLLPRVALAQEHKGPLTARTDAEKKHDAEIDRAYRAAIKDGDLAKSAKTDPWQTIRTGGSGPSAQSTQGAKSGSAGAGR